MQSREGGITLQEPDFVLEDEKIRWQVRMISNDLKNTRWAIYGTGNAADIIYDEIIKLHREKCIKYILDQKKYTSTYKGHSIQVLEEVADEIDVIWIAAKIHHRQIYRRIMHFLEEHTVDIQVVDVLAYNMMEAKLEYINYLEEAVRKEQSKKFIDFNPNEFHLVSNDTKIIAWYLPQFHQIDVNHRYLGQGFTEWTNTSRMLPLFVGHEQPHIPYDVGYYDLMNIDTLKRQIFLAKHYGIYGFAFHYYWFSGKRIMEKPLQLFLAHDDLDMPFCISWATENWTTLWDGGNRNIIHEQKLDKSDFLYFFQDMLPYIKDKRYIKIEGKPVFIVYRCTVFEKNIFCEFISYLRRQLRAIGFPGLYVMLGNYKFDDNDVLNWNGDALVEYQPHMITNGIKFVSPRGYVNPYFSGRIIDVSVFLQEKKYMKKHRSKEFFRSALTSWDNTARKCTSGATVFEGFTPEKYKVWLKDIMMESKKVHGNKKDFVFVNSWNEWAEGSHLEPDMRYGYAYLEATRQAIEELREEKNDL